MAPVPTTPTATDKLEEVRKLNLEIAGLTSAKDTAARAAKTAQDAADSAKARAEGITAVLEALEASQAGTAAEVTSFVAEMRAILESVAAIMHEAAANARALEQRVGELCTEIEKQTAVLEEIRMASAKEGTEISRKRDDLNIWHRRILAAAEKHLPGVKIQI